MKNFLSHGENITLPAPADLRSGAGVLVGTIFGVAQADAASGAPVVLVRRGLFTLPKTAAQAWTPGAKVYWDGAQCTTAASGNTLIGAAAAAAANPSETGTVLLDGTIR
ncbi:hypothetical protein BV509_17465 [Rhodovulum sulfidophilum]|uniref:DUF2190 family protein n=2 Tax=Rhodovulum visakhapatnamense TaxID=364297 RepID=A0ABS1RPU0_9RHOB|nr:DUF2190 family protein [Rhodovulum visakhapatnamense]MBL3571985.1 DUF2190 family protein [Rhodovulum visakhapatnamense]MBL3580651.1 DUF2190 family protein [Rhodovulum visakhapatnamense]OLS45967.1 hypothetical protein BV509_17465 [Rhodovulum sulfidophilum]